MSVRQILVPDWLLSSFLFHRVVPHKDIRRGGFMLCLGVQVSVFVWHLHGLTHTRQLLHTLMPGLGLMDGCVKHTPLDLGWDDCSVGLLTGCQGGYAEHTAVCVLRSPNNSCALWGRENKQNDFPLCPKCHFSTGQLGCVLGSCSEPWGASQLEILINNVNNPHRLFSQLVW